MRTCERCNTPYSIADADMPCLGCWEDQRPERIPPNPDRVLAHKPMQDWTQQDIEQALELLEAA